MSAGINAGERNGRADVSLHPRGLTFLSLLFALFVTLDTQGYFAFNVPKGTEVVECNKVMT